MENILDSAIDILMNLKRAPALSFELQLEMVQAAMHNLKWLEQDLEWCIQDRNELRSKLEIEAILQEGK